MRKMMLTSFSLVILSSAITAARADDQKSASLDYFPLRPLVKGKEGDWWKYELGSGNTKSDFTMKVVKTQKQADKTDLFQIDTIMPERTIHSWFTKGNGVVLKQREQFGDDPQMMTQFQPAYVIKNTLKNGDKWEWSGKGQMGVEAKESFQVSGPETVVVPAGKFETMKLTDRVVQGKNISVKTVWFANQVGMVKSSVQTDAGVTEVKLVDYAAKKKSSG